MCLSMADFQRSRRMVATVAVVPCDISVDLGRDFTQASLAQSYERESELAPLWWTSRKGLLSSEFRQCSREKIVQIHSRKTLSAA